jgi:folate-binding protein YgfZ
MPTAQLQDRSVIALGGEDAHAFLQNIITADMDDIDRLGIGYSALLTPQGKIICDFLVTTADDGYRIDVRLEAAETLTRRLTLYRLRAKVDIAPRPDLAVFAGWDEDAAIPEDAPADPRLAALGHRWIAPVDGEAASARLADWHQWRISLGVPEGGIDFLFDDAFPHDGALDALAGVAFDKGCYVGQEVVSRMRHRGTARRRIVQVSGDGPLPDPGTEILAAGQPVGRLGSSSANQGIAVMRLDRLEKALAAGKPVEAGTIVLQVALPDWASYGWPSQAADAETAGS